MKRPPSSICKSQGPGADPSQRRKVLPTDERLDLSFAHGVNLFDLLR